MPYTTRFSSASETVDKIKPIVNLHLAGRRIETNEYRILAFGPFSRLIHQCSEKPWLPQLPETRTSTIEEWKQVVTSNPKTYAGPQFRLEGFKIIPGDTLVVQTSLISYNIYVGCRDERKLSEIARTNKIGDTYELAALPLNVSAMIVFSDQVIPVQKRSFEVDVDPGMVYLPGGQLRDRLVPETMDIAKQRGLVLTQIPAGKIKPEELYVYHGIERHAISPLKALSGQIFSETGIPPEHFISGETVLLGLIQAKGVALHPELVFLIPCSLTSKEAMTFKGEDAWEGKYHFASSVPGKIAQEIKSIGNPVPILQGALALYTHMTP